MSDLKGRYPLSTPDGKYIPLDVVRPHGVIEKSFLFASPTAAMNIPATIDVFSVYSTQDVIIKFASSSASAAALSDGVLATDVAVVLAGTITILSPPVDKRSISLKGRTVDGLALLSFYENWSGLTLQSQITRR